MFRTCLVAFLLVPVLAHADPAGSASGSSSASSSYGFALPFDLDVDPELHLDAGFELLGGRAMSYGFRGQALVGARIGHGDRRLTLAVGATYGSGELEVDDRRGLDGTVTLDLADWGPEAQAGIDFTHGTLAGSRLFASFALLHVTTDSRLRLDMVPGVAPGGGGTRAAIGMNFAQLLLDAGENTAHGKDAPGGWCLAVLTPQQVEVGWERDAGSDRVGVAMSWGI